MRTSRWLPLVGLLALVPATTHAQVGAGGGWRGEGPGRPHPPTHADSTRTLTGAWQVWGHLGVDWLGSPGEVKSRHNPGFGVAVSGDRRFADRIALRGRIGYHDLPSKRANVIYASNSPYAIDRDYGHGFMTSAMAGVAARTWNHLWLEGVAGTGYFRSGVPSAYVDPVTGQSVSLGTGSGWGGAWGLGARYEFQPNMRDRMLAECQFLSMDRDGTTLNLWTLRIGYRGL